MSFRSRFTHVPQPLASTPTVHLHYTAPIDMVRAWCEKMWDDDEIRWVLSEPLNSNAILYFSEPLHAAITYATWYQYIMRVE